MKFPKGLYCFLGISSVGHTLEGYRVNVTPRS